MVPGEHPPLSVKIVTLLHEDIFVTHHMTTLISNGGLFYPPYLKHPKLISEKFELGAVRSNSPFIKDDVALTIHSVRTLS